MSTLILSILGILTIGAMASSAWGAKDDLTTDDEEKTPVEEGMGFFSLTEDERPDSYRTPTHTWGDDDH